MTAYRVALIATAFAAPNCITAADAIPGALALVDWASAKTFTVYRFEFQDAGSVYNDRGFSVPDAGFRSRAEAIATGVVNDTVGFALKPLSNKLTFAELARLFSRVDRAIIVVNPRLPVVVIDQHIDKFHENDKSSRLFFEREAPAGRSAILRVLPGGELVDVAGKAVTADSIAELARSNVHNSVGWVAVEVPKPDETKYGDLRAAVNRLVAVADAERPLRIAVRTPRLDPPMVINDFPAVERIGR